MRTPEQRKIENSLSIVRIILDDFAAGEQAFQFTNQFRLIGVLSHQTLLSKAKNKSRVSDTLPPSIICREFFAFQYLKKNIPCFSPAPSFRQGHRAAK